MLFELARRRVYLLHNAEQPELEPSSQASLSPLSSPSMTTAHNSSTGRYLIPSGSAHFLKSKKELYSGGKKSHEYLMTFTEKTISSHFESDIRRDFHSAASPSRRDVLRRTAGNATSFKLVTD